MILEYGAFILAFAISVSSSIEEIKPIFAVDEPPAKTSQRIGLSHLSTTVKAPEMEEISDRSEGCKFFTGDVKGGGEEKLRDTLANSEKDCESKVIKQKPTATGATWSPTTKKCYAEYGNIIAADGDFRACLFKPKKPGLIYEIREQSNCSPFGRKVYPTLADAKRQCNDDPLCEMIYENYENDGIGFQICAKGAQILASTATQIRLPQRTRIHRKKICPNGFTANGENGELALNDHKTGTWPYSSTIEECAEHCRSNDLCQAFEYHAVAGRRSRLCATHSKVDQDTSTNTDWVSCIKDNQIDDRMH